MVEENPLLYWPYFGPTVTWVAFLIGILMYVIGYIAGGKMSKGKILVCIIITSIISFFSRPVTFKIQEFLSNYFNPGAANVVMSIIWTIFVVGIGIHMYETFTVTAEEARPD